MFLTLNFKNCRIGLDLIWVLNCRCYFFLINFFPFADHHLLSRGTDSWQYSWFYLLFIVFPHILLNPCKPQWFIFIWKGCFRKIWLTPSQWFQLNWLHFKQFSTVGSEIHGQVVSAEEGPSLGHRSWGWRAGVRWVLKNLASPTFAPKTTSWIAHQLA